MPRARVAPQKQRAARPSPPEDDRIEAPTDWLRYGELRLQAWSAPSGQRGRLQPVGEAERLRERRAPSAAVDRLVAQTEEAEARVAAARSRALPPHHVLPGPIAGTDVRIDAQGTVDLASDGLPHSVSVEAWPATLEVAYRAVPREDARAYRRVTARIGHERALLPGPVDVYVAGKLELTSPWAGSEGRGVLVLGLGVEDRLKLVRNVRYSEVSAGVFGGSRRLQTEIEVEVASEIERPVAIDLLERVPVAADDKVAVEQTEASPPAEVYKGEVEGRILAGGRRQHLEVPAGGTAKAVLTYAVTLGSKDEIVGGDRRG
ncbi:MAG: DUF4139 domain-containing protein [Myxococcota bacterium]